MASRYLFLALLILAAAPCLASAQGYVEHKAIYTTPLLARPPAAARSALRMVSPAVLPRSVLLHNNAIPGVQPARGVASGSADTSSGTEVSTLPHSASPQAVGTQSQLSIAPYSTARASASALGPTKVAAEVGVTSAPWRETGKLYFKIGPDEYVCSASMIRRGLVITAAHCVFEYGEKSAGWHTDFQFVPAQYAANATPPYGVWSVIATAVLSPYYNGTDTCVQAGVVCNNDLAILTLAPDSKSKFAGDYVGWYSYSWNGYSFVRSFGDALLAAITQLGYPVAFDDGLMMERNDGIGAYWMSGRLKNTVLGTAMTGGASGGPWLVNFGAVPQVDTTSASLGTKSNSNVIMGVTSWGIDGLGSNTQGASWFGQNFEFPAASYVDSHKVARGAGNIGYLMMSACNAHFDRC